MASRFNLQVSITTEEGRVGKRSTDGVGGGKGLTEVKVQGRVRVRIKREQHMVEKLLNLGHQTGALSLLCIVPPSQTGPIPFFRVEWTQDCG